MADATHRSAARLPRWTGALLFAGAVACLIALTPAGAEMLSPALVLVAVVRLGLFTGERPIAWATRLLRRLRRRPRRAPQMPRPVLPVRRIAFGTDVPHALAMRPPPLGRAPP